MTLDDFVQKGDGVKVRNAEPREWEAVIGSIKRQESGAESDLSAYLAAVASGNRKADPDHEKVLRQAVTDRKITLRILEESYNSCNQ